MQLLDKRIDFDRLRILKTFDRDLTHIGNGLIHNTTFYIILAKQKYYNPDFIDKISIIIADEQTSKSIHKHYDRESLKNPKFKSITPEKNARDHSKFHHNDAQAMGTFF